MYSMIRKLIFAAAAILIGYWIFLLAIEGTKWDNPPIFYVNDKDATYKIVADPHSGYYLLDGNNSHIVRRQFYIPIATAPADLSKLVGKRIKIKARTGWAEARKMPCQKGKESWCNAKSKDTPIAVFIEKLEIL